MAAPTQERWATEAEIREIEAAAWAQSSQNKHLIPREQVEAADADCAIVRDALLAHWGALKKHRAYAEPMWDFSKMVVYVNVERNCIKEGEQVALRASADVRWRGTEVKVCEFPRAFPRAGPERARCWCC